MFPGPAYEYQVEHELRVRLAAASRPPRRRPASKHLSGRLTMTDAEYYRMLRDENQRLTSGWRLGKPALPGWPARLRLQKRTRPEPVEKPSGGPPNIVGAC